MLSSLRHLSRATRTTTTRTLSTQSPPDTNSHANLYGALATLVGLSGLTILSSKEQKNVNMAAAAPLKAPTNTATATGTATPTMSGGKQIDSTLCPAQVKQTQPVLLPTYEKETLTTTNPKVLATSNTNSSNNQEDEDTPSISSLPEPPTTMYTREQVDEMLANGRIVVYYKNGVYDATDFSGHPGGCGRLQMAAGGDLGVYWSTYTQHNRGHVVDYWLKMYKIGNVTEETMTQITAETYYDADAVYGNEAEPYPDLLVNTRHPLNCEGKLSDRTDSFITPIGKHFVRNHNAVPDIDPDEYTLTIIGEGMTEHVFTLNDLKTKFDIVDVTTVIQCNGNRREDFHYLDGETPAFGPPHWVAGAIGNCTWTGVRLRDLLRASGMDVDAISLRTKDRPEFATHVGLLGYDHDECGNQYCCSFPFDKAIDPYGDVIVAFQMNGEDIPRPYGYPVRCIVPGNAGARNCKYLERVNVTNEPCKGNCNWKQYAVHAPDVPMIKIAEFDKYHSELEKDPAVQEMPVQSMITSPSPHEIVASVQNGFETVYVKGVAWGGGGSGVNRVDVSLDGGEHFTRADLIEKPIKEHRQSQWSWQFFEKDIPIPKEMKMKLLNGQPVELILSSKCFNTAWNVQPSEPNYNAHGCCVNHWYKVPVTLCPVSTVNVDPPICTESPYCNKPSGGHFQKPFVHSKKCL